MRGLGKTTTLPWLMLLFAATAWVGAASAQVLSEVPYDSLYNGDVSIKRLFLDKEEIGSTVWLKRSENLKAHYIATGQVYQRYSTLNKKIILVCEGAFTNGQGSPHGLTIDNGTLVNRDLLSDMDGLVIVYATGGIVVSDIEKDWLHLDGKHKLDIRTSEHKTFFVDWAQQNSATVFQTQLLASSRGLRLDVAKAQKEVRERRFLAIIQHANNTVTHVLVDVPKEFHLGPLAKSVYDYLRAWGTVVGLLNLDTGDYNIFQINNASGQALSYPAGRVPLNKATNLLVYYYAG